MGGIFTKPASEMSDEELFAALEESKRARRERINEKGAKKRAKGINAQLKALPPEALEELKEMLARRDAASALSESALSEEGEGGESEGEGGRVERERGEVK